MRLIRQSGRIRYINPDQLIGLIVVATYSKHQHSVLGYGSLLGTVVDHALVWITRQLKLGVEHVLIPTADILYSFYIDREIEYACFGFPIRAMLSIIC